MRKAVGIREVAREAGVSISAVSQALAGTGRIAEETRKRIRAVSDQLGYRPNPLMAAMASRAHRMDASTEGTPIAYFTHNSLAPLRADYSRLPALIERGEALGYRIHHYELREFSSVSRLQRLVHAQGTAGVLIGPLFHLPPDWHKIVWDRLAVVVICDNPFRLPFYLVKDNVGLAARTAVEEAHRLGYRRIGVALMEHDGELDDDFDRFAYALSTQVHLDHTAVPIWREPFSAPDEEGFVRWVRTHRPDVVIGFPSVFLWRLRQLGLRVPKDVAFVSLNKDSYDHANDVAGFSDLRAEVAREGMQLLDLLIRHHRCGELNRPPIHFIRRQWEPGRSLPGRVRPRVSRSSR